jgi:hypothetical protein
MSNPAPSPSDRQSGDQPENQTNDLDDLIDHPVDRTVMEAQPDQLDQQHNQTEQVNRPNSPNNRRSHRSPKSPRNKRLATWLEQRFCVPEFAGAMLLGLSIFFFAAATNTLAGWLYVISGVSFALLLIGAVMPAQIIKEIEVVRSPLEPASAGDMATIELKFANLSRARKKNYCACAI